MVTLYTYHDYSPPDISHFAISQSLAGLKKRREFCPNKRDPIKVEHIVAIYEQLHCIPVEARACFWAACLVAFFTLLRKSNLFREAGNNRYLRRSDFLIQGSSAYLRIQQLKTVQFKSAHTLLPLPQAGNHQFCPVSAIILLLQNTRSSSHDPLFSYMSGAEVVPLSARAFVRWLREVLAKAFLPTKAISCHSFRRGAATFAAASNIHPDALKAQGLWKSSCFERYINRSPELREQFVAQLSSALQCMDVQCN